MDDFRTQKLYQSFPIIYRERLMTLAQSEMPRGFQCDNGWYEIICGVSANLEIIAENQEDKDNKIAVTEVRADGNNLIFRLNNNNLPPAGTEKFISSAQQRCQYTCETCGYSPAFLRNDEVIKNKVCCNRCVTIKKRQPPRRRRRAPRFSSRTAGRCSAPTGPGHRKS